MTVPSLPADDRVRAVAAEILARADYARWRSGHLRGVFDILLRVERWLDALQAWLGQLADTRPWLYAAILVGLLTVSVGLFLHVAYAIRRALTAAHVAAPTPHEAPAAAWLAEAERLARAGRTLEAAHQVQLAVLALLLEERGLELARGEPNRVLRTRLRTAQLSAAERVEVLALLDRLEARWFRDRAEDPGLYEAWCALHARVAAHPQAA